MKFDWKQTLPEPKIGDLRVWHIPQIPGKQFFVPVKDIEQAKLVQDALADYDLFQLANRIKPDYANASGLMIYEDYGAGPEWIEWYDDEGNGIDDYELFEGKLILKSE